jgi:hypothetical protein
VELQGLTPQELDERLSARIRVYSALSESHREEILRAVRDLIGREMPPTFVLSSARSLARQFAEEEEEAEQPLDSERQQFIAENAVAPEERVSARRQPRSEAKAREREQFSANVKQLLREARSARQPHERKKLRRELMGIDQRRLRRALGREGQELSDQIREVLLSSTDLR